MIIHSKPWLTEDDLNSVRDTLNSGMIAQGQRVEELEHLCADWIGANGGVAVASGSAALVLALKTLSPEPGDEVILPTYVCESVYEAAITAGMKVVLCDVGLNWVVEPKNVEPYINSKTKAIIVPHMYGIFADITSFLKFNIPVIEDMAQAVGDKTIDKISGTLAVLSFHPTKCLTSGEGGMVLSKDPSLVSKAREIRDGNKNQLSERIIAPMSDIQASLGISQIKRYSDNLRIRREIAGLYLTELASISLKLVNYDAKASSMFFRFPLKVKGGLDKYKNDFEKKGIHIRKGVDRLIHRLLGEPDDKYPTSVDLFDNTISIPIYPALTKEEIQQCMDSFKLLEP